MYWEFSEVWVDYLRKCLAFKNGRRRQVRAGSNIDYIGNELGSNFGSSSVSISSESNLDERQVVVLVLVVKLFTSMTGERCVNVGSKSVRRLKLSRFPRLLGWARFHPTCHSGISMNLWCKSGLGMCSNRITVTSSSTSSETATDEMWTRVNWRITPKTGNKIHHFRQPPSGQPKMWGSSLACSWTWLIPTDKFNLIGWTWCSTTNNR